MSAIKCNFHLAIRSQKMLLRITLLLILCLGITTSHAAQNKTTVVPEFFSEGDLQGENPEFLEKYLIIANFEQRLQLADGKLSKKKGRILVIEKNGNTFFAFYSLTDSGKYRKIGRTLATKKHIISPAGYSPRIQYSLHHCYEKRPFGSIQNIFI